MSENRGPTVVEINLSALRKNFRALKRRVGRSVKVLAVVKSNAYGHGAVPVSRILQSEGADAFGVGTVDEGVTLRRAGIRRPILILPGLIAGRFGELLRYCLTPILYDLEVAKDLQRFLEGRRATLDVHIKVDTGMTRLGVLPSAAPRFFATLRRLKNLRPGGLVSHLADADEAGFTGGQVASFERFRVEFQRHFPRPQLHLANSLASIDRQLGPYDLIRLGIALYGAYPVPRQRRLVRLEPVMRWRSRLTSVKSVPKGAAISYGRTFITHRQSRIGVVPVGYADGYHRLLSNRADLLVRGRRVPVVGTICMDMMMVDLTQVPAARVGDEVVLLGRQGRELVSAEEVGRMAETIAYEILCHVAERVPRVYHC